MIAQFVEALRARGYVVEEQVGQSRFRCDLALRDSNAQHHRLGVLVDSAAHYANPDVVERCVPQPSILRAFGWEVLLVLPRDWFHEPDSVLERIERMMRGA